MSKQHNILYLYTDGPVLSAQQLIESQDKRDNVDIVDLTDKTVDYDELVDKIFACDQVLSW